MPDHRTLVETALADPRRGVEQLAALPATELEHALRALAERREAALPVMTALAEHGVGAARRAARRALYRLAQSGVSAPARPAPPLVARQSMRAVRAWMSGIDGTGARAAWVLFEGGYGGLALCSLLLSDTEGVLEVAGGEITRKRLETELARLRAEQKLPWVELPPGYVIARAAEAHALHARLGTTPPSGFSRWEKLLLRAGIPPPPGDMGLPGAGVATARAPAPPPGDMGLPGAGVATARAPAPNDQSRLLELPELMGWFVDPDRVQADAVQLLEAQSSRLVVSDQTKAEREQTILQQAAERELAPEARTKWAMRLVEMALIFETVGRAGDAALARTTARDLADPGVPTTSIPFARGLVQRALHIATEIASGRIRAEDVRRRPGERGR